MTRSARCSPRPTRPGGAASPPRRSASTSRGAAARSAPAKGRSRLSSRFCPTCKGARYNQDTLEVKFRGKDIAEVLDLSVEEGVGFFQDQPAIARKIAVL